MMVANEIPSSAADAALNLASSIKSPSFFSKVSLQMHGRTRDNASYWQLLDVLQAAETHLRQHGGLMSITAQPAVIGAQPWLEDRAGNC